MTDFDLEKLGEQWRQQPGSEELEGLKRSAETARSRARWGQIVDAGAAVIVAGVVILLVLLNPDIDTFLMGGAAILVLLFGQYRQRRLRGEELRALSGPPEEMLDQSIRRLQTTLRHNRFALAVSGPGLVIGYLFASTAGGTIDLLLGSLKEVTAFRIAWGGATIIVVGAVLATLIMAIRRQKRELERLSAMRESYRREDDSSAS